MYIAKYLNLPFEDLDEVYVVSDYDRTITPHNKSSTSWGIMSESGILPKEYKEEREALFSYYHPMEISSELSLNIKKEMMHEWFQKHLDLFSKYKLRETDMEAAVKKLGINLRPGFSQFANFLYKNNVPLIIMSAGIANFIELALEENGCNYPNISIVSNHLVFENGTCSGVEGELIYQFNKSIEWMPKALRDKIASKHQPCLMGDSLADLDMLPVSVLPQAVKVGFVGDMDDKTEILMHKSFDILFYNEDNFVDLSKVLFDA